MSIRQFRSVIQRLALVALVFVPRTAWPQAQRAIILGQVRDTSDSVVPGAQIRVIQTATNVVRSTITNDAGHYEVPGLLPGAYRVEASLPGFKTTVAADIEVASAQRVTVNLVLEIGQLADTVTVESSQVLSTAGADVNTVIDLKYLKDAPIGQGHATFLFKMASGSNSALDYGGWGQDVQPRQRAGTGLV